MDNQVVLTADGQQSEKTVIIYRSEDGSIQLEVQLVDDNVWLTQNQMTILFETTKQNISLHINNAFKEGESVLKILNKREDNVAATIYTAHISENLKLDLGKRIFAFSKMEIGKEIILSIL